MPITNLNNVHFSQGEKDDINTHWAAIRQIIDAKKKNFTPEERQKFGSISEENKLVVLKTLDFDEHQSHLNCPDVDYQETRLDWGDRTYAAGLMSSFEEYGGILNNIRISHDYDAYQAARTDYNFTKYKMETGDGGAGWETKYKALLPFFKTNKGGNGGAETDTPTAES